MSELAKALLAFQKEAPDLPKTHTAKVKTKSGAEYSYKYADLGDIAAKVRPLLNKHGVIFSQALGIVNGRRVLQTTICHAESGDTDTSTVLLPDTENMQELGSAITYARRYGLIAHLGLVAEDDDDGARSSTRRNSPERPQEPVTATPSNKPKGAAAETMTAGQRTQIKIALEALEKEMPSALRPQDWVIDAAEWSREQFSLEPGAELNKAQAERLKEELDQWLLDEQAARAGAKA